MALIRWGDNIHPDGVTGEVKDLDRWDPRYIAFMWMVEKRERFWNVDPVEVRHGPRYWRVHDTGEFFEIACPDGAPNPKP